MIITIDGPTASGKSSVARMLAHDLGYTYLNSGLLYRGLAYVLMREHNYSFNKLASPDETLIMSILDPHTLIYTYSKQRGGIITYGSQDITAQLKLPDIDQGASIVSSCGIVRTALLPFQQALATTCDLVADGRDCGTIVFPHAHNKFFLTARHDIRALRWLADQALRGFDYSLDAAIQVLDERDMRDAHRTIAPLVPAHDAHIVDNSAMTLVQTVEYMKEVING